MILVNGNEQAHLHCSDRALQYGDGVFETLAFLDGRPLAWDRHMQRLAWGCERLGIAPPDRSSLYEESLQVAAGRSPLVIKIIISRGSGGRAYTPPESAVPTRIVSSHDWPAYPPEFRQQGIKAGVSEVRLGLNPLLAGIKHLNRLEQVLIRQAVAAKGLVESVVLDLEDRVIEGSMSNIFLVCDGKLVTPSLETAGVQGVIRDAVLELAQASGIQHSISMIQLDEVLGADEVFFCNSIAGIWPVRQLQDQEYLPGPVSQRIQELLLAEHLVVAA